MVEIKVQALSSLFLRLRSCGGSLLRTINALAAGFTRKLTFVDKRRQSFKSCKCARNRKAKRSSGVPQGSLLGPFFIFSHFTFNNLVVLIL